MGWNPLKSFDMFGSALRSGFGGGKDPGKKQLAQILAEYNKLQNVQKVGYANALAQQKKGLGAIQQGYTGALNATNSMAGAAKTAVLDREKANLGALKGGLADSGMLGGTLGANLERGVYSDTNRGLANVDAQFAELRSNLMAQKAGLEANAYGGMAGLFQNQVGQQTGLGQSLIGTLGSVQHTNPNQWMTDLLRGGMNLLPFLG